MVCLDKSKPSLYRLRKAAKLDPALIVREVTEKKQDVLIADILLCASCPNIDVFGKSAVADC